MTDTTTHKTPLTLLGLGSMGTALAHAWLAAGHPVTVWNRSPERTRPLAAAGAAVAATPAAAVAASPLVVTCLLDDASVGAVLAGADLRGKDLVDLTTGTPATGRARAAWAAERGARFLDGGIMAVPPMVGVPGSGAYVFYSGDPGLFEAHRAALEAVGGARYVGADPGHAALYDSALLSAMYGMFAGVAHAYALIGGEDVAAKELAPLLAEWLGAMTPAAVAGTAERLDSGDLTTGVVSNLAMQAGGTAGFAATARGQGVSTELLDPYFALLRRGVEEGRGDQDNAGLVGLLRRP
ncbi:NAD(P)-binding domain-containing protein [Streptomyces sp. NPDC089919]|uniref:NAD(P)-dependent oxidoreductase n=1 Tax=Streptomyces sp. NPDC089919 TaxID=3155188 RepID=UPI00342B64BA